MLRFIIMKMSIKLSKSLVWILLLGPIHMFSFAEESNRSAQKDQIIQATLNGLGNGDTYSTIIIDYPFEGSVFPPDIVAPIFLWHDSNEQTDQWLIHVEFENATEQVYDLTAGRQTEPIIDPNAISETNKEYKRPDYDVSAKAWTAEQQVWEHIKKRSVDAPATVTIYGLDRKNKKAVSKGQIRLSTSPDPVGAPIFYRDVPLMPTEAKPGETIKPIVPAALPEIAWRLRDISKAEASVLLKDMPTCANCHSFSSNGQILGMDLDGPDGDKGAYALADISSEMVIKQDEILTWGSYKDRNTPKYHNSFGLFSRVSPDGRYVVSTLNESVFVINYSDFRFLQSFYPTRGILVVYDKVTGKMTPLPGGSDPRYVQTNAVWSPDGKELIFSRALAKDKFDDIDNLPTFAGDERETEIQYDLYRIPFNNGKGGVAEPVKGASHNGMSNSFPKYSPNGKWIVYVQAKRGQLLRPDSKLYIIPAEGGEAREMNCNLNPMNSWHSWSPNSKWLVFSSKGFGPFTKMFLTHIDDNGNDTPAILIPNSTAANRAVNIPEFLNGPGDAIKSISAPTQRAYAYYFEAWDQATEGKNQDALKSINQSIEMNPHFEKSYFARAWILLELGRSQECLNDLLKFTAISTDIPDEYKEVAFVLISKGRAAAAVSYLDLVNLDKPELINVHENYRQGFKHDEEAQTILAFYYMDQQNYNASKTAFENLLKTNPQNVNALNGLAWIQSNTEAYADPQNAINLARAACRLTQYSDPDFMETLCGAFARAGQYEDAVTIAEQALALLKRNPNSPTAQRLRQRIELYKKAAQ